MQMIFRAVVTSVAYRQHKPPFTDDAHVEAQQIVQDAVKVNKKEFILRALWAALKLLRLGQRSTRFFLTPLFL